MVELIFVSQILGTVAGSVCLLWSVRYFYKMYVNKKLLSEIKKLTSRVSVLKLMLRARLRKNCNMLSKIFKGEATLVERFQDKYQTLTNFDLNSAEHYQKIISTLKEIATECESYFDKKYRSAADTVAHKNDTAKKNANKDEKIIACEQIIEFDLPSLLIIREIVLNQTGSRILIEKYNSIQESKRNEMKMPIELKIENQEILFDLVERAHEKKKVEKPVEGEHQFDQNADEHKAEVQDVAKIA